MVPLTGAPKTVISVTDTTNLLATANGGIICVQGETLRGEPGKAVFVGSSGQFKRLLGGLHPSSPFPAYCLRLLNAGAKLWVSRAAHYSNVADRTTVAGTKATGTIVVSAATTATFRAKHVGPGYNGATVQVVAPTSFQPGYFDLIVSVPDSDQTQTVRGVKASPTSDEIAALNAKLEHVELVSATALSLATVTLGGGVQDVSAIVAADYIGDPLGRTGFYAFSTVTDAFRIANLHKPNPQIDVALANYVIARGDMRAHLGMPLNANAVGLEDYRMGSGSYSHSPVNTWQASFVGASTVGNDGTNLDADIDIPGVVEALTCIAQKDITAGPWFSAAGPERGQIRSYNKGVPYNLVSPDLSADFDRLYLRGVNAIVQDDTYGPLYWGNRSALLDNTKILSKENVADLMVYLIRTFRPVMRKRAFQPNDPQMWRAMYRDALPIIEDLERRRAIEPGEGVGWAWLGDQDANSKSEVTYNVPEELDAGKYRAGFIFKPIGATEYLNLSLVAADSNSFTFAVTQGSTL